MKRIATFLLLAGVAGGCASTDASKTGVTKFNTARSGKVIPGVVGPAGEPVMTSAKMPVTKTAPNGKPEIIPASATESTGIQQTAGFTRIIGGGMSGSAGTCNDCNGGSAHLPGHYGHGGGHGGSAHGGFHGIIPAPPQGAAGVVAGVGMIGPGFGIPVASNMRTAIKFLQPQGAKVTWLTPGGYAEPNFHQGNVYRLRVSGIATRPGKVYFPTLEIAAATPKSLTFLDHGTVPVSLTDDDLARVDSGNLVVKVIYLPDSAFQEITSGVTEELASPQLDPGVDPIVEANRRGTILAIIRVGNINLENPASPAKDAPPMNMGAPGAMPAMPPSAMPSTKATGPTTGVMPVSMVK
jgi:hypothetical protein